MPSPLPPLPPSPAMEVVKTDTVKMEYVQLPVVDLSYRFLYRFLEPVATIWQEGKVSAVQMYQRQIRVEENGSITQYNEHQTLDKLIGAYAVDTWRALVLCNCAKEDLPEEARWLVEIEKSQIHECQIIRVDTQE